LTSKIPLLIVGDGPQEPTGLGRIARDLASLIVHSDLPVDLVQLGGTIPPVWSAWRHYPIDPSNQDWGAGQVTAYYRSLFGSTPGIVWLIWDPGRLYAYTDLDLPVQKWAYTAIDATNRLGSLGGPARVALETFDRVLAYGEWASQVVRTIRPLAPYLPHGLQLRAFTQDVTPADDAYVREMLGPFWRPDAKLIGCVATNQPRKDLGLFCESLVELKARGHQVYGWLHTDVLVKAWSIQQLVADCGLQKQITVTVPPLSDPQLALLYRACDVTMAPGLGEGFGYPIVESLAAGVPVIHGGFAGGVELVPKLEWRPPIRAMRLDSVYALQRPVFRPDDVANACERAWDWVDQMGSSVADGYCRLSVAHLDWSILWPRWRSWIRDGL
jgi:glycosyltransferase involved in cell wall biosynthesis